MSRKLTIATFVLTPAIALAYVDPAPALLERAAAARARMDLDSMRVEGVRVEGQRSASFSQVFRTGVGYRTETRIGPEEVFVSLVRDGRRWSFRQSDTPAEPQRIPPTLWSTFISHDRRDRGGQEGLAFLRAYDIDPSVVSLSRQDRRPVYVIGAKPWEPDRPQLWLDKDLLVPVRLVVKGSEGFDEVRLFGFDSETGPFFPSRVEEWSNGRLTRVTRVERVVPNAPVDPRRLDPPG